MFEIIGNDIALLNEEDLRTLVALLCESELRRRDLAIASVTWGGDQNSSDGGLGVRVELPAAALIEGFVPRPITGFQVKKKHAALQDIGGNASSRDTQARDP